MNANPANRGGLAQLEREVVGSFEDFERSFRRRYPLLWLFTLVAPFGLSIVILSLVSVGFGPEFARRLLTAATVTFFAAGRFIILGGEMVQFMTPAELFVMVTYMDLAVAMLLVFHIGIVFKIPVVGPKIAALVVDGQFILEKHRWMKRATFIGLIAFVTFPLAATGSIGGCIFGRLLGLGRLVTFLGVLVGSLVGNGVMYLGSDLISKYLPRDNVVVRVGGIVVIVLAIILLERRYRRMKRRFVQKHNDDSSIRSDSESGVNLSAD